MSYKFTKCCMTMFFSSFHVKMFRKTKMSKQAGLSEYDKLIFSVPFSHIVAFKFILNNPQSLLLMRKVGKFVPLRSRYL